MEQHFNSAAGSKVRQDEVVSVIAALEPDQIISSKEQHHCARRRLSRTEMVLFWALRIYLVFMVGVVLYQIWTGMR